MNYVIGQVIALLGFQNTLLSDTDNQHSIFRWGPLSISQSARFWKTICTIQLCISEANNLADKDFFLTVQKRTGT